MTRLPRVGRTRQQGPRGSRNPTVSIFTRAFAHVVGRLEVPAVLVTPHLKGRPAGPAGDRRRQREVVAAALALLVDAPGPQTRRDLAWGLVVPPIE